MSESSIQHEIHKHSEIIILRQRKVRTDSRYQNWYTCMRNKQKYNKSQTMD